MLDQASFVDYLWSYWVAASMLDGEHPTKDAVIASELTAALCRALSQPLMQEGISYSPPAQALTFSMARFRRLIAADKKLFVEGTTVCRYTGEQMKIFHRGRQFYSITTRFVAEQETFKTWRRDGHLPIETLLGQRDKKLVRSVGVDLTSVDYLGAVFCGFESGRISIGIRRDDALIARLAASAKRWQAYSPAARSADLKKPVGRVVPQPEDRPMRVLVFGGRTLTPENEQFAEALGAALLHLTSCVIVTGGLERVSRKGRSVDEAVWEGAKKAIAQGASPDRINTVLPRRENPPRKRFHAGEIRFVEGTQATRRFVLADQCDVPIAIDGTENTRERIEFALEIRKPCLLIPLTGGAAADQWQRHHDLITSTFALTTHEIALLSVKNALQDAARACARIIDRVQRPFAYMVTSTETPEFAILEIDAALRNYGYHRVAELSPAAVRRTRVIVVDVSGTPSTALYTLGQADALRRPAIVIRHTASKHPMSLPGDSRTVHGYDDLVSLRRVLAKELERVATSSPSSTSEETQT